MTERDTAANVRRQMPAVTTTAAGATAELRAHHYHAQVYRDTRRLQCQSHAKLTSSLGAAATNATLSAVARPTAAATAAAYCHSYIHTADADTTTRNDNACIWPRAVDSIPYRLLRHPVSSARHTYTPLHPPTGRAPFGGKAAAAGARARRRGSITSCRPAPNLIDRCASWAKQR